MFLFLFAPASRKAARRERQRGRAATSAAASRMFTDQSQRCLAQGAAFCRNCTFQVHDRFRNFARYKDTDSDSGQTKNCVRANLNLEDENSGCILRQLRATAMPVGLYIFKH